MSFFCNKHFLVKGAGLASERYFFRLCTGFGKLFFWDCIFHCMNCVLLLLLLLVGMHHGVYRFAGNFIYFYSPFVCCVLCVWWWRLWVVAYRILLFFSSLPKHYFFVVEKTIPSGLLGEFCGVFIYINCVHFFLSSFVFWCWIELNWIRGWAVSGEGLFPLSFGRCEGRGARGWWMGCVV